MYFDNYKTYLSDESRYVHIYDVRNENENIANNTLNISADRTVNGYVDQIKNEKNGSYHFNYNDILYDKIHVIPQKIDFGVIAAEKEIEFEIWNAYLKRKYLKNPEFSSQNQGLYFRENLNTTYEANQSKIATIVADSDGISIIDVDIKFQFQITAFDLDETAYTYMKVVGERDIGVFQYKPQSGYLESFEYNTDIIRSYSGNEQRISILQDSRVYTSYNYILSDSEFYNAKSFLNKKMGSKFFSPQWSQSTRLKEDVKIGDTIIKMDVSNKNIQINQTIMLKSNNDYENVVVSDFDVENNTVTIAFETTKEFKANYSEVVPCYLSYIDSASSSAVTDKDALLSISFKYDIDEIYSIVNTEYELEKYNDKNVLLIQPNKTSTINVEYNRDTLTLDPGYGIRVISDINDQNFNTYNYNFFLKTYEEIHKFKAFINDIRGRAKDFYIPSFERDLELRKNEIYTTSENAIKINNINYTNNYLLHFRDIIVNYKDSSYSIYQVINSELNTDLNYENLTLDRQLDKPFESDDVESISFLYKARFLSDTTNINYITDSLATVDKNIKILKFTKNNN